MSDKPKILLLRPLIREYLNSQSNDSFESSIGLVPPLNLCCLAAEVERQGYEVAIYDCEASGNSEDLLGEFLTRRRPRDR